MRIFTSVALLLWLVIGASSVYAQVPNDDCATAQNLGSLPAPRPCNGSPNAGVGDPMVFNNLTNTNAVPSAPYPSLIGCQPSGNQASPASDVWYTVTVTGPELTVNISGGLNNPNVAIWEGPCGSLVGRGCARGTGTTVTATFTGLTPGVYYLQVSGGNVNSQGNFNMTLNNNQDCANCVRNHNLTATPAPINGTYQPGTTVTFCYEITEYFQANTNWLHGVVPTFGAGWNTATLGGFAVPVNCDANGQWSWFNSVTSSATGNTFGPGFFFDRDGGPQPGLQLDGNPGNNFGANCTGTGTPLWRFCWTITTRSCPPGTQGQSLGVTINTLADGESGSWSNIGCVNDPDYLFSATLTCCEPPVVASTNVTCFGGNNGTITATGQGTGSWNYVWRNGGGTVIRTQNNVNGPDVITGLTAGTYTVTVTDNFDGCQTVTTVVITHPPQIVVNITAQTNVLCNGQTTGSATASASGGTGTLTYNWSNGQSGPTATGLGSGTYTVSVTDGNGCLRTTTVTITQPPALVVNITAQTNVLCNGGTNGSATASGSGGTGTITYNWSNGQSGATATGLAAGTYTVTATDANGCQRTATVTITQPPLLVVNITAQTNVLCNGGATGSATASGSGGTGTITYNWSNGQSGATATGLAAGTYTVTATDANGCQRTATVTITQPPAVVVNITAQTNVLCNGGTNGSATASGSGGTGTITYNWSNGQSGATATGLGAGTYTVTATDGNGCQATTTVTITQPPAVVVNITAQTNVLCNGGTNGSATASGSGGTGTITYNWSNGQSGATATGLAAGTYTVTATDANGCQATTTVTITQPPAVVVNITAQTNVLCNGGATGSATASGSGGTGTITYNWSNGQSGATATGLAAGTYTVTATDANGCQATTTVTITEPTPVVVNITAQTNVLCNGGATGSATASGSGGTGSITYNWSNGQSGATASGLAAGTYTVTATDANGCQATTTVTITEPTAIALSGSTTDATCGNPDGTATVNASGGNPGYTYLWSNGQTTPTAINLAAGPYTVTVTDQNGCQATLNLTVNNAAAPTVSITSQTNILCNGQATGSATASGSGGVGTLTYAWSNGQSGTNATGLAAGTYTVTVTDGNGCQATASVTITEPTAVVVNISAQTNVLCNGGATGSATASGSGGTGTITYNWSNGQSGATASGLAAGTYTVTATDANGCQATTTVTITEPTPVVVNITAQTNVLCNGGATGSATASGSGGTGTITYSWSNGQSGATATGLASGTYTVTATDANGCQATTTVTITEPTAIALSGSTTDATCGNPDGTATVNASGGNPGYTYLWSNGQTTPTAINLAAGPYTVTVTDQNGCQATLNLTVNNAAAPTVSITAQTNVLCNGGTNGSATASGSGGVGTLTYSWSNGQSGTNATGLAAGTYTVTVTDGNGCQATASVTITEPTAVVVNISAQTNVLCNGGATGSATASGSGGTGTITYNWSNGQSGATASGLAAGTYTVTATDANGCQATTTVTITEPTPVVVNITAQTNVLCNGGATGSATASGSGGTGTITYSWSNGQSGAIASGLAAGTYTVTATDANGCQATTTVTITEPTPVVVNITAQTNVLCNGGATGSATASGSGGTGTITYNWSNGQSGATASGLAAGTYTVTATDANGCQATTTVTITEPTAIALSGSTTDATCGNADGTATVNASGGSPGYTYLWSDGQTTQTATGLLAGPYTVTVTDQNGCQATLNLTVNNAAAPTVSITSQTNVLCNGQTTGSATASGSGGVGSLTYAWSNGQSGTNATGLGAGTYTVTVTDGNGCQATASVTITEPTAVVVNITAQTDVLCNGGATGSATASGTGGTGTITYNWSNGQSGATATGLAAGTYTVTATDANGCQATTTVTIIEPTPVVVNITAQTDVLCNGGATGSATASGTGGTGTITYNWSNGQSGATATGLAAGTYTVTATDANGCQATTTVTITEPTPVAVNITSQTDVLCNGGTTGEATAAGSGGTGTITYAWSNGQSGATATGLAAGTYTVTATDANGCQATTTVTITEPAALTATVTTTDATCGNADGTATANPSGGAPGYIYSWSNGQTTQTATGLLAGNYVVTVTDQNGCFTPVNLTVNNSAAPSVVIVSQTDVLCNGQATGDATASGSGGVGTLTYAWSNGQSGTVASGLAAGTYTVTVTDGNGCQGTASVTITEPTAVVANISGQTDATCNGAADGTATAAGSGGTPGYTYLWSDGQTTATATALAAGTYTVTVTDLNGCQATNTVTINEPTAVAASISGQTDANCNGAADGTATAAGAGGTPGYTYLWSDGQTTQTASNLAAGTYAVTVTDLNGCQDVDSVTIGEPTAISLSGSSTDATCGNADGTATVTPSGGTPGYTFLWNNGQTTATATNLLAGSFTVTVSDNNGCQDSLVVTVANAAAPTVAITGQTDVLCNGQSTGDATALGSGGVGTLTYLWSNGQTTPTATGLAAGTYDVTVTDGNGCQATASVTITEPTLLTVAITGQNDVLCNGGTTGDATALGSGGTGTINYLWSDGQTTATATGLAAGTYFVTATDANGCTAFDSVVIAEPTALVASISGSNDPLCNGGSDGDATASGTGGTGTYSYLWSDGQTSATATNLSAGTYGVTLTDANGCQDSISVTLNDPALLVLSGSTTPSTCGASDGTATVNATGGTGAYTYLWSDGQTTATATTLAAGNYAVTVTDANGCMDSLALTVNNLAAPVAVLDSTGDVTCFGFGNGYADVTVTGGTGPLTYAWNTVPAQNTPNATNLGPGNYTLVVTDSVGCQATVNVTINEPTALVAAIDSSMNLLCFSDSSGAAYGSATGGTGTLSYLWNNDPNLNTAAIVGIPAGLYEMVVTDSNGCADTVNVTLTEPTALSLTGSTNPATCGNADGDATVVAAGGTPGYSYAWNTNPAQTTPTASALLGGNYQVVVTDSNGCMDSLTLSVNTLNAPSVTITTSVNVSCNSADDGMAMGQVTGGTAPFTYGWNTVPPQTNPTAIDLGPGTYTLTVTDSAGCVVTDNVTITEPDSLLGVLSSDSVSCFGLEDGSATVALTGGTLPYSVVWNTTPAQTDTTASLIAAGTYTVTVTDANGCQFIDSVAVGEPLQVVAAFISSPTIPATLDVLNAQVLFTNNSQNAVTYTWDFGDGNTSPDVNPTHTYNAVGDYCVLLTAFDAYGCQDTAEACFVRVINLDIIIPNTFTPNGDGTNDFFEIVGIGQYPNNRLEVFNRWGNLIYFKDQYDNTWNGVNIKNGLPLPDGGYFFIFYPNKEDEENVAGDVVIFR